MTSPQRIEVTAENRPAFRELAAARIIFLRHTFARRRIGLSLHVLGLETAI